MPSQKTSSRKQESPDGIVARSSGRRRVRYHFMPRKAERLKHCHEKSLSAGKSTIPSIKNESDGLEASSRTSMILTISRYLHGPSMHLEDDVGPRRHG